jgi:hypothetical protein
MNNLYNTGFLENNDILRRKQGLSPMQLANACAMPVNNFYTLPLNEDEVCNNTNMYPVHFFNLSYGTPPISNSCPCTRDVQAP